MGTGGVGGGLAAEDSIVYVRRWKMEVEESWCLGKAGLVELMVTGWLGGREGLLYKLATLASLEVVERQGLVVTGDGFWRTGSSGGGRSTVYMVGW